MNWISSRERRRNSHQEIDRPLRIKILPGNTDNPIVRDILTKIIIIIALVEILKNKIIKIMGEFSTKKNKKKTKKKKRARRRNRTSKSIIIEKLT